MTAAAANQYSLRRCPVRSMYEYAEKMYLQAHGANIRRDPGASAAHQGNESGELGRCRGLSSTVVVSTSTQYSMIGMSPYSHCPQSQAGHLRTVYPFLRVLFIFNSKASFCSQDWRASVYSLLFNQIIAALGPSSKAWLH
jgi:hypothetical protein